MNSGKRNIAETSWVVRFIVICLLTVLSGGASVPVSAQPRVLVQGILDGEVYKTDARSYSLARNNGDISTLARLQLWSAWQVSSGFQIYALGELESDNANAGRETNSEVNQFALRYSSNDSPFYFVEVGKILPPIATASTRYLSTQNPLIGLPSFLYTPYQLGIQVAGSSGWFDYRMALVDQPAIDPEYLPSKPGRSYRPDLGIGVSPFAGLRFGLSYTRGPYLSRQQNPFLPPGSDWNDYEQELRALEVQFSRGYAEFNGEVIFADYEIPFQAGTMDITDYFLELKYTWTPRVYGALRFERNQYPFIRHLSGLEWLTQDVTIHNLEVGLAYRFSADTQVKVAYRRDFWHVQGTPDAFFPSGHSVALQLSHHFDAMSWFRTER